MNCTGTREDLLKKGVCLLLGIKDSDIRLMTLLQGKEAVDRGIHIGGAFSAVVPMVSLYYGGYIRPDIQDPCRPGQDLFVLSKGHCVSSMASIYADLGLIEPSHLTGSRSLESILNGHPGPLLRGVHVATGPLAQGLAVAQGLAMAGKKAPSHDVYTITGDGELQEGVAWEAIMYAPQARLDNLCLLVDKNEGQLDNSAQLIFPMEDLPRQIESFGWRVFEVDGTSYSDVTDALDAFVSQPRDGRPTAIVCHTRKGFGAFSGSLNLHKVTLSDEVYRREAALQEARRSARAQEFLAFLKGLESAGEKDLAEELRKQARTMGLSAEKDRVIPVKRESRSGVPAFPRVPRRDKAIRYNPEALPSWPMDAVVAANEVIKKSMAVFAEDPRVVSVDSDLGSTSGLEGGIAQADQTRAINVGIAESNMMCVGEAFAALGCNAWVSTFCPFFDWKVLRRIAVGAQERRESMESPDGWLSPGHGLDLTFLATASNLDTQVNGATHMGNDDILFFSAIAGLNIIDVSCPNQLVGILRWIMEGNRGLNYLRIMRAASGVLYPRGFEFEYGKAYRLRGDDSSRAILVSSGRGTHEACGAADLLAREGIGVEVYDMPSFDAGTMKRLLERKVPLFVAEQNNGYLRQETGKLFLTGQAVPAPESCRFINVNKPDGSFHYIHSATYAQLTEAYGLSAGKLAEAVRQRLETR